MQGDRKDDEISYWRIKTRNAKLTVLTRLGPI